MRVHPIYFLAAVSIGCTEVPLFGTDGAEPNPPDRVILTGELCTEDASGSKFPAKVLFVMDTSNEMMAYDLNGSRFAGPPGSMQELIRRNEAARHVRFGFSGVNGSATAYPVAEGQTFWEPRAPEITTAFGELRNASGPNRDVTAALGQVGSFINKDIAEGAPGEALRSRYLVSMLFAGPPIINGVVDFDIDSIATQVLNLKEQVYAAGALEFKINVGLLAYSDTSLNCYTGGDPAVHPACACDPTGFGDPLYCQVYCDVNSGGVNYNQRLIDARQVYEAIAFAGDGVFREFACPPSITLGVDVASSAVNLVKKEIVAFNRNARLTPDGQVVDSDGDGLADFEEEIANSGEADNFAFQVRDWDGDLLTDRIEYRTYPRQDPSDPTDRPTSCESPIAGVLPDRDRDFLNDCEEGLLQSSPTVPDTDGDGLADLLEFLGGTIPISADDRLLDFDADGVGNAEEVQDHTDPRSNEGILRGQERYRNTFVRVGDRTVANLENPPELRGLVYRTSAPTVVGGQSYIRWDPCLQTLEWSDARYPGGQPSFDPIPLPIGENGTHRLWAEAPNGERIWAEFRVTLDFMPGFPFDDPSNVQNCATFETIARPLMTVAPRACYDVRISNIKLMQTRQATDTRDKFDQWAADPENPDNEGLMWETGRNEILVFFSQAPESRLTSPGITKTAQIIVNYQCDDPNFVSTCRRDPDSGFVTLTDDMFISSFDE